MNPEQSNPLVLVPPHTYGIPERFFAISRTAVLCVGADAARVDFLVVGFFWVWRCVFFGDAVGGVLRRGWGVLRLPGWSRGPCGAFSKGCASAGLCSGFGVLGVAGCVGAGCRDGGVGVWAAGGVAGREGAGVCWLAEGAG